MIKLLLSVAVIIYIEVCVLINTYNLIKSVVRYLKLNVECSTLASAITECTALYTGIILNHMRNTYYDAYVIKSNERIDEYMLRDDYVFREVILLLVNFVVIGIMSVIWA